MNMMNVLDGYIHCLHCVGSKMTMNMNKSIVVRLIVDELYPLLYSNVVSENNYIHDNFIYSVQYLIGGCVFLIRIPCFFLIGAKKVTLNFLLIKEFHCNLFVCRFSFASSHIFTKPDMRDVYPLGHIFLGLCFLLCKCVNVCNITRK